MGIDQQQQSGYIWIYPYWSHQTSAGKSPSLTGSLDIVHSYVQKSEGTEHVYIWGASAVPAC